MTPKNITKPKQARSKRTKEKIIEAGEKLFSEIGYRKSDSKKIAEAAGVAIGSFYNYFPDKKQLLLEIYRRHLSDAHGVTTVLENFDATKFDPKVFLANLLKNIMQQHENAPAFHMEMDIMKGSDDDFARIHLEEQRRIVGAVQAMLDNNHEHFRVKDTAAAAYIVVTSIEAVFHSLQLFEPPVSPERILTEMTDWFIRYLHEDD